MLFVEPFIFLGSNGKAILELDILFTVILSTDTDKLPFLYHMNGNQTLLAILDLHHTLNGIIQHISKKGTNVHITFMGSDTNASNTVLAAPLTKAGLSLYPEPLYGV